MQTSSSFEHARNGRKRPSNLLPGSTNSYELPIASPSFNCEHVINTSPTGGRYTSAAHTHLLPLSKHDNADTITDMSLPPTPVSAGLTLEDAPVARSAVTLPSINHLLAGGPLRQSILTPPTSGRVPMGPRIGCEEDITHFDGPRPQWVQDRKAATLANARAASPPQVGLSAIGPLDRICHVNPETVDRSEEGQGIVGLGSASTDDAPTPRIGSFGNNALGLYIAATPTQAQVSQGVLRAPVLEQQEEGIFPTTTPASPINPPLRAWNTDLEFPDVGFSAPSPRLTSVAMEREQHVVLEDDMPQQRGLRGLAISLDGQMDPDNEQPQASSSKSRIMQMPPTPLLPRRALPEPTGLTPTLSSARIIDVCDRTSSPRTNVTSSPSLRTKSKMRSELVRREAEATVCGRRPGSGSADAASAGLSPLAQRLSLDENPVSSPRKRTVGETDLDSAVATTPATKLKGSAAKGKSSSSPTGNSSSPWGVFRLKEEGWKSLSPPGGGKALGMSAVRGNGTAAGKIPALPEVAPVNKKQRKAVAGVATSVPVARSLNRSQANKENIAPSFDSSASMGRNDQLLLGGKSRRAFQNQTSDVFGSEAGRMAPKRTSISSGNDASGGFGVNISGARRASAVSSRPSSARGSGAVPRRRL